MLEEKLAQCPYCWENIYFEIDLSEPNQEYVEDCQVCCNPILLRISTFEDTINTVSYTHLTLPTNREV